MTNAQHFSRRALALALALFAYLIARDAIAQTKVEMVPFTPHGDQISDVRLSADGTRVITVAVEEDSIKIWELKSGRLIRTVDAGSLGLKTGWPDVTPDGRYLAAVHTGGSLHIVDLQDGGLVRTIGKGLGNYPSITITPDGQQVVTGREDGTFQLWDFETGKLKLQFGDALAKIQGTVAVLPDGRGILVPYNNGTVKHWDLSTGQNIRTFSARGYPAVVPGGRRFVTRDGDHMEIWNLATGERERIINGIKWGAGGLRIDPAGRRVFLDIGSDDFTKDEGKIEIRDLETGSLIRTLDVGIGKGHSFVLTADGRQLIQGSVYQTVAVWDTATGQRVAKFGAGRVHERAVAFTPDGQRLAVLLADGGLQLWDMVTGEKIRSLVPPSGEARCGGLYQKIVATDRHIVCADLSNPAPRVWDLETGRYVRVFRDSAGGTADSAAQGKPVLAAIRDGQHLFSAINDTSNPKSNPKSHVVKQWELKTGRLVRTLQHTAFVKDIAVSPDGRQLLTASMDKRLTLWSVADGKLIRSFNDFSAAAVTFAGNLARAIDDRSGAGRISTLDLQTLKPVKEFPIKASTTQFAISEDGKWAAGVGYQSQWNLELWDLEKGELARSFKGLPLSHRASVGDVAISPDGKRIVVAGVPTGIGVWDAQTGNLILSAYSGAVKPIGTAAERDEWLTITPEGFFRASSPGAAELVSVVRGLQPYGVDQMWQSLFNPDLVREKLEGDPSKEVEKAAAFMDLAKVLESGKAPGVAIASHAAGARSAADVVTIKTVITDQGGGVGRIEWRVNGVTAGVAAAPKGSAQQITIDRQLALDPGDNMIEVVAYNGRNLLASALARTTVTFAGPAATVKPKLHVLAIGINAYVDRGWTSVGATSARAFPPLNLAVSDAAAFAAALKKAGGGQYAEVNVTEAFDEEATAAGLERIIARMAAEIHPRDTFVLFAAAHGASHNGRFYLIPQDYDGGPDPAALQARAVGQDRLQDWMANRIRAKRAVLLLDTCESGALVSGYTRSRTDVPSSEAAIGRLHEATGRPVLTAAAEGKPAFEGFEGRGVFTWTLLDALKNGDRNGNGTIELSELVAHVQEEVPSISAKLNGRGHAAVAARGSTGDRQSARFGSRGEDFVLVGRLR